MSRLDKTALMGLVFCCVCGAGLWWLCFPDVDPEHDDDPVRTELVTQSLAPETDETGILIQRSLVVCPAGDCVIRHYPPALSQIDHFADFRQSDFGEIVWQPDNRWYSGQDRGVCVSTFNCGTFAVGDLIPLTPSDWLGTDPTTDGRPTPLAVILDSFFDVIRELTVADAMSESEFKQDRQLRDGDVVTFEVESNETRPIFRRFTHAGRLQSRDGVNRLLSKFGGFGPVALTNLRFPQRMFPGADVVRVYRYRNAPNPRGRVPST